MKNFYTTNYNANLAVEVDKVNEDDWNLLLTKFNDANIYQTWAYGNVRWGYKNLSHIILKKDDEIIAAAQVRIFRKVFSLIKIAYIRWGPLWRKKNSEIDFAILRNIYKAIRNEYVVKRRCWLWILPNEIDINESRITEEIKKEKFIWKKSNYRTIVIDLNPPLEDLRNNLHKNWKRNLKKSEKNDLNLVQGISQELFQKFISDYNKMLNRKSFFPGLNVKEFLEIQKQLPEMFKMQIFSCENNHEQLASIVISAIGDKGLYLLGATTDIGLKYSGSFLLQWTALIWLKNSGFHWYDLSGINPILNPGGFQFKSGMAGHDVYHIGEFEAFPNVLIFILMKIINTIRFSILQIKKYYYKIL